MPNRKLKLLLVEDNQLNQKLIKLTLAKYGFIIDTAANGAIGLDLFLNGNYDLILMDIMMPVMDGLEATRRIRGLEQLNGKKTPIVGLTANTFDQDRQRCIDAGMDEYLVKPFDVNEFIKIVDLLGLESQ